MNSDCRLSLGSVTAGLLSVVVVYTCLAYMEIGTANVSAIIGAYSLPVAMTTDKFSLPYLVTSMSEVPSRHQQLNVISILPLSVDLVTVTLDFITRARWTSLAVLAQPHRGALLHNHHSHVSVYLFICFDAYLCALILSETLALYKSFTYLLTYLFSDSDDTLESFLSPVAGTGVVENSSHRKIIPTRSSTS